MSTYNGWSRSGFAAANAISLTTSYTAFVLEEVAAVKRSQGVPDDAHLYDILFELSAMATSGSTPTSVSFYIARDAAGTKPLTQAQTANIVKALGAAAATGGAQARLEVDFHSTLPVGGNAFNSLYLIAKLDAATATSQVYLNWWG